MNGVLRNLNEMGDKFLIQLMGLVDEIENEKRFVRGTIGKLSSIRKGQHWGGRHLFGYKRGKKNGSKTTCFIKTCRKITIKIK